MDSEASTVLSNLFKAKMQDRKDAAGYAALQLLREECWGWSRGVPRIDAVVWAHKCVELMQYAFCAGTSGMTKTREYLWAGLVYGWAVAEDCSDDEKDLASNVLRGWLLKRPESYAADLPDERVKKEAVSAEKDRQLELLRKQLTPNQNFSAEVLAGKICRALEQAHPESDQEALELLNTALFRLLSSDQRRLALAFVSVFLSENTEAIDIVSPMALDYAREMMTIAISARDFIYKRRLAEYAVVNPISPTKVEFIWKGSGYTLRELKLDWMPRFRAYVVSLREHVLVVPPTFSIDLVLRLVGSNSEEPFELRESIFVLPAA